MNKQALGIIDYQRGFLPAEEGERLGLAGFGELPVSGGAQILPNLNALAEAFESADSEVFTTQDWHPSATAHFSDQPDFANNWPVHCVGNTAGAELHPELTLPDSAHRFVKGFEALDRGEDDTSYSAHFAQEATTGESLPDWLNEREVTSVYLAGLALDYCVGKSALDLKSVDGFDVTVVLDASRGISEASSQKMLGDFATAGVKTITTDKLIRRIQIAG